MEKEKKYAYWNGKNLNGESHVGDPDLIQEGARDTKTAAKYEVGNDTVSADNLQKEPKQ